MNVKQSEQNHSKNRTNLLWNHYSKFRPYRKMQVRTNLKKNKVCMQRYNNPKEPIHKKTYAHQNKYFENGKVCTTTKGETHYAQTRTIGNRRNEELYQN